MPCPHESTLVNFACGWLDTFTNAGIELHLQRCPKCRGAVDAHREKLLSTHRTPTFANVPRSSTPAAPTKPPLPASEFPAAGNGEANSSNEHDAALLQPAQHPRVMGHLAGFDILRKAGEGTFAMVYKAADWTLGRTVALKVLRRKFLDDEEVRLRFLREARAAATLGHPNVVTVHALTYHDDIPVLVMEYISGRTIRELCEKAAFTTRQTALIGKQIAAGLAQVHHRGIIHRDIKPSNIMVGREDNRCRIIDFGLSRFVGDELTLTGNGHVIGTPGFLSPEQAAGDEVDFRSDLFGLGGVLYAMLTGTAPFRGEDDEESLRMAREIPPTPLQRLVPTVPKAFEQIVDKLLRKNPAERYQSASEVEDALQRLLATLPSKS